MPTSRQRVWSGVGEAQLVCAMSPWAWRCCEAPGWSRATAMGSLYRRLGALEVEHDSGMGRRGVDAEGGAHGVPADVGKDGSGGDEGINWG